MEVMHDIIGIGFGPANIALAIALKELAPELRVSFLEAGDSTKWHPDMLLAGSDIQNNPLRDLVTPRNPKSHFSFVNFLKETGRLFDHLNLGVIFPLRIEYFQYVQWAARQFEEQVHYNSRVRSVVPVIRHGGHVGYKVETENGAEFFAKSVVFAPGRTPYVPRILENANSDRIIHFEKLLSTLDKLDAGQQPLNHLVVVGSSQSAVEVTLELRKRYPHARISNVIRNFGFRQKDVSPFTGEVFYPEYSEYYFESDKESKDALDRDLRFTNYSAADSDVLDRLYLQMYEDKICGNRRNIVYRNSEIQSVQEYADTNEVELIVSERFRPTKHKLRCDLVISATGFRDIGPAEHQEKCPPLLEGLLAYLRTDTQGCVIVGRDYDLVANETLSTACPLILNGLCEKSHGMGDAGSFSLLSLRAEQILKHIMNAWSSQRLSQAAS